MSLRWSDWPANVLATLRTGAVIPAHPLALDAQRKLDPRRQRALTRYYVDAGSGGLAVGVHTTQFAIRDAGLFRPVLELAARTAREWTHRPQFMIAGAVGHTAQAVKEAQVARGLGYHAVLLSLAAMKGASEDELIAHAQAIAREMPLVGFYLQPAVGGHCPADIVLAALCCNRECCGDQDCALQPLSHARRGARRGGGGCSRPHHPLHRQRRPHLPDLVTPYAVPNLGGVVTVRIKGGLLGHWSVWARKAVELLEQAHHAAAADAVPAELLAFNSQVTDCNAAIFDVANNFHGVIAGCHEILRRQGLLAGIWCLDPAESLGPGQKEEIDRICAAYPHLNDDAFVRANLDRWLA